MMWVLDAGQKTGIPQGSPNPLLWQSVAEREIVGTASKLIRKKQIKAEKVRALEVKQATPEHLRTDRPKVIPSPCFVVECADVKSSDFLRTKAWRELRYATIKRYGPVCQCCGATAKTSGEPIHVAHIKPRSLFPGLAMAPENLQVLCAPCSQGKSNTDFTDWRPSHPAQP